MEIKCLFLFQCGSYLTKMDQHKRFELFLQTIDQYMRNRNESMVASLGLVAIQPYRFKCPYEQDDVSVLFIAISEVF